MDKLSHPIFRLLIVCFSSCSFASAHPDVSDSVALSTFRLQNHRMVVPVILNEGVVANLVIDNACQEILLTEDFLNKHRSALCLKLIPQLHAMEKFFFSPKARCSIARGTLKISLGNRSFQNKNQSVYYDNTGKISDFILIYENKTSVLFPAGVDGILPLRLLTALGMLAIDFPNKTLYMPHTIDSAYSFYPLDFYQKTPFIRYPIQHILDQNKAKEYTFKTLFDLGFSGNMLFFNTKTSKQFLAAQSKQEIPDFVGKNIAGLDTCLLGKEQWESPQTLANTSPQDHFFDLMIGINILKDYTLIFDYAGKGFYLKPSSTEKNKRSSCDVLHGARLALSQNSKGIDYIILRPSENHPHHFLPGDQIIKIGTLETKHLSSEEFAEKRYHNPACTDSITVLRKGKKIVLYN